MADDSPGKVQALRAIFAEKNKPVMGMMPPGGKMSNRPWKSTIESNEETTTFKERLISEQRSSQLMTKVLPISVKKSELTSSTNSDLHKDNNGYNEKANKVSPKPSVGPKPSYLTQQTRTNSRSDSNLETLCDTRSDSNRTSCDGQSLFKSQAKSKAVAETIASFMFTNGFNHKTANSVLSEENNKNSAPPPLPLPRNTQMRTNQHELQTELINLCNSQNSEKLIKSEAQTLCCNIINSDNYICKSNCNFRRKELPSLEKLGPPPLKPTKPEQVVLPEKYRLLKPSVPVTNSSHPPTISPPSIPQRPAPQRPAYPCPPRPHTPPPLPPLSAPVIKSSLSLREEIEELYEDTILGEIKRPVSLIPEYTEEEENEELYNDAEPVEENPRISITSIPQKPKEPPPPCPSEYLQPNVHNSVEELYQDADEVNDDEFYEEMPCDAIAEEPGSPLYSNNKKEIEKMKREEEKKLRKEQKEKEKRDKEMEKLKRKFGLTGDEIPIDDGLVKMDSRGSRSGDLPVKKGETVLILRMEGNPQGRWLVKNEKGKIGYVELTNIEVDPLSVKSAVTTTEDALCTTPIEKNINWLSKITACVMTIRRFSVISASEELYSEAKSEEEGIYEITY
ncbi:FYN-binding protein [Trichonephila clavata]|uniref:FYN-binding protein n=1 Tax=Trichonephila clavata TaxID=2740835 RepID=A0A8X6HPW2_TRICU|nr:FYN-binding protein [Trichonephila clavata]